MIGQLAENFCKKDATWLIEQNLKFSGRPMNAQTRISASLVFVCFFIILAVLVFIFFARPYLDGESDVRWAADSLDYIYYYQYAGLEQTLIQLGQNLFGPLAILQIVEGNHLSVLCINIAIYLTAWFVIVKNVEVNKLILFFALALNPMLFVSMLAVNKEIISFLVISLYAAYLSQDRFHWLILALVAAIFVRWQNVFIILIFELIRSPLNPLRTRRLAFLFLFVIAISIIYPSFDAQLGGVTTEMVDEQQASTTFGLLEVANNIQRNYGYFIVVIPKVFSNWFGNLPRVGNLFINLGEFDVYDIYNTFVITGHQAAMTIIFLILIFKKRLQLSNDLVFFSIIYSVVYSLGMFIQYRYYFPVYIAFCIVLSQKQWNYNGCLSGTYKKIPILNKFAIQKDM